MQPAPQEGAAVLADEKQAKRWQSGLHGYGAGVHHHYGINRFVGMKPAMHAHGTAVRKNPNILLP